MKNLLKITLCGLLLTALIVNVKTSRNDKIEKYSMGTLVVLNTANAEGAGYLVKCHCAMIWGSGCRADNYGDTCSSGDDCPSGDKNCSD